MMKKYIGILKHPGYNGDFADDVLGFDPNGGGIFNIPIIGDIAEVVVENPLLTVAAAVAIPALAGMAGAAGTAAAAGGAAGATASGVLAAQSAELIAAGFSAADVAVSLAGLGEAAAIESVLVAAGVDALEAASLASETVLSDVAINNAAVAAQSSEGMAGAQSMQAQITPAPAQSPIITQPLAPIEPLPPADWTLPTVDAVSSPITQADMLASQYAGFTPEEVLAHLGTTTSDPLLIQNILGASGAMDPLTAASLAQETVLANSSMGGLTQAGMLADQYRGFTQPEVVSHMAGSAIDPVMAEEILGTLGMDPFAVSDYMKANPTSFGNIYADPSFLDRLKQFGQGAKDLSKILGPGLGGAGGAGSGGVGGGGAATNYEGIMSQLDPYWGYRKNTEIPMMGAAAGAAGTLSGLYQQSFTDPLQAYNTPEMQALNAQFMGDIERKDAATGRMSQYGARDVQAQNQYLTNTLPAYRQNLQQGLGTLYQAARTDKPSAESAVLALNAATDLRNKQQQAMQGTVAGSLSNLQGSWNQMTGSNNILDQVSGAVNTASNVADLYNTGTKAWNTLSNLF